MNKLTRYDKKQKHYVRIASRLAVDNTLGKVEELMEKYEIEDLSELEIALDQYYHRYDNVQTRRVEENESKNN